MRSKRLGDMGWYRSLSTLPRKFFSYRDARAEARRLEDAGLAPALSIPTDTDRRELVTLFALASARPSDALALEVGSYLGASSCFIAAGLAEHGGHLYCVDTWHNETMVEGPRDTYEEFRSNTRHFEHLITPIRKKSSDLIETDIETPLDLVFLDGDHSYQAVRSDFELVSPWLAEDGVIVFHDFAALHFDGVSRVVGEALATGEWVVAGLVESMVWIQPARWVPAPWLDGSDTRVETGAGP